MRLEEYAIEARKTAVFNPTHHISYPSLGLCDETAEFVEKLMCDGYDTALEDIKKEAGDVCWYFNCVCEYSNLHIVDFFKYERVTSCPEILIQAGKIAGVAKKALRDHNGYIDTEKMRPLLEEFSGMLLYFINDCGFDLEDVLATNIAKLRDRQRRNVIQGNGDHR